MRLVRSQEFGVRSLKASRPLILFSLFAILYSLISITPLVFAEEAISSTELVKLSWEASGTNDFEKAVEYTDRCVELYQAQAKEQGATLSAFSPRGHEDEY